jgi:hypothetical protein
VKDLLREEWKVLARAKAPDMEPGSHCTNPFGCEFYEVCNKPLPVECEAVIDEYCEKIHKANKADRWLIDMKLPPTGDS